LCKILNIPSEFKTKRISKKRKNYNYESNDEIGDDTEQLFKVEYFLKIIDCAIVSLESKFEQYKYYNDIFGFLHKMLVI